MFWIIIGAIICNCFLFRKASREVGIEEYSIIERLFIILIGLAVGGTFGFMVYVLVGGITSNLFPSEYTTKMQVLDSFGDSSNIYLVKNDDGERAWVSYYYVTDDNDNEVQKIDTYEYYAQVEDSDSPYLVKYEPHFKKGWYNWFSYEEALDTKYEFHIPENSLIKIVEEKIVEE